MMPYYDEIWSTEPSIIQTILASGNTAELPCIVITCLGVKLVRPFFWYFLSSLISQSWCWKRFLDKQTLDKFQSLWRSAGDCAKSGVCDIVFCRIAILFVHCGPATMCDIMSLTLCTVWSCNNACVTLCFVLLCANCNHLQQTMQCHSKHKCNVVFLFTPIP